MIQKPARSQHSDPYVRAISHISRHEMEVVRDIINAQYLQMMLQFAQLKGTASTFLGEIKVVDGTIVITKASPYVINMLNGKVESSTIAEEISLHG